MTKPKGWPSPSLHCREVYPLLRHCKEPLPPSSITLLCKLRTLQRHCEEPTPPHYVIARRDGFCPDVAISDNWGPKRGIATGHLRGPRNGEDGRVRESALGDCFGSQNEPRNDSAVANHKSEIATHPSDARNDEDGRCLHAETRYRLFYLYIVYKNRK